MLNTYLKLYGTPIEIMGILNKIKQNMINLNVDKPFWIGRFRFQNHVTLPTGITKILKDWTPWKSNLIVNNGRTNLLHQWADTSYGPVAGMGIGNATTIALADTTVGTESTRLAVSATVNTSPNWNVQFQSTYTATQINGATAIGLFDNATKGSGTMLTKSVFSAISIPAGSSMTVQYQMGLSTGVFAVGWTLTSGKTKTYQISQGTSVAAVVEMDTGAGYSKQASTSAVESNAGSYYYDSSGHILYVHCSDDADPATHSVLVISGAT